MLMAGFFFAVCAAIFGYRAVTNDRGLILNGIFHFGLQGATTFYWCLAAVSAVFVAIGFTRSMIGLFSNLSLQLSETELSAPRSILSLENTIVPLSSIVRLDLRSMGKLLFLDVHHAQGKLTIAAANLPDQAAFNDVCAHLAEGVSPRAERESL